MPIVVTGGLGQGGYAVVLKAAHPETNEPFALKVRARSARIIETSAQIPQHSRRTQVISKAKAPTKRERGRLAVELKVMTEVAPSPFLQRCHMAFESTTDIFFVVNPD